MWASNHKFDDFLFASLFGWLFVLARMDRRWSYYHRRWTPRSPQDHAKITPRPRQDRPLKKWRFFTRNVSFSLEKCRFGANRRSWHYVLKRERGVFENKIDFPLEICVIERGGRAARCMGSVPVADLLASEARHARTSGRARHAYGDPSLCLFPGDRSRESCGTWQLPQTS